MQILPHIYYTTKQVQSYLGINRQELLQLFLKGDLGYITGTKLKLVKGEDLLVYLKETT